MSNISDNLLALPYLAQIGDRVFYHSPTSKLPAGSETGTVVGFYECVTALSHPHVYYPKKPGVYRRNGVMRVAMDEEGGIVSSDQNFYFLDLSVSNSRRINFGLLSKAEQEFLRNGCETFVRPLPAVNKFYPLDVVATRHGHAVIFAVEYNIADLHAGYGDSVKHYSVNLESGGYYFCQESDMTLIAGGHYRDMVEGNPNVFSSLQDKANFQAFLGRRVEVPNEETQLFWYTRAQALRALQLGLVDELRDRDSINPGTSFSCWRYIDEEVGSEVRSESLKNFE